MTVRSPFATTSIVITLSNEEAKEIIRNHASSSLSSTINTLVSKVRELKP